MPLERAGRLADRRALTRRQVVLGGAAAGLLGSTASGAQSSTGFSFGLTPVFLDSDVELLAALRRFLEGQLDQPVHLVKRRSYQEIMTLLLTGQLDAAWICGFPFIKYRDELSIVAVPLYLGQPLYQSYVIVRHESDADRIDDLRGHVHAFSDPDSNSGFLVTRHLLSSVGDTPASFFRRSFFTWGHRNVVRAVAAGLADSGSVDGYVWDVMAEIEPDLIGATKVIRKSEWLGFPPVACLRANKDVAAVKRLEASLLSMPDDPLGREVLATLRLDGFTTGSPTLFDEIAAKYDFVRRAA